MRNVLDQIRQAVESNLYFPALFTTLALPDICGALDSEDGLATKVKYVGWFDKHVLPQFIKTHKKMLATWLHEPLVESQRVYSPALTGDICYRFRCSLLHQGRSQFSNPAIARVLFIEPGKSSNMIHMCQMHDALVVDLRIFCAEVLEATHGWLEEVENTERFQKNFTEFASVHPNGLSPYIRGVPVVG